jgi:hypothetical protein
MPEGRTVRRAVKRPAVKQPPKEEPTKQDAGSPWKGEALDVGDRLEYGATVEVKTRQGLSYWPKASASISIRPNETVAEAKDRVSNIVDQFVAEAVEAFMQD